MNNDNVGKGNQTPREHDAFREVDGWDAVLPSNSLDYEVALMLLPINL